MRADAAGHNGEITIMTAGKDPKSTVACPDLMGAMLAALDVDTTRLARPWNWPAVQQAIARCTACAARVACRQWLGGAADGPGGYRDFCPNAGLFERFKGPAAIAD